MTDQELVPVCRNCNRAIWRHVYSGESIWRHFDGFMLCEPNEDSPSFNGERVAEPTSVVPERST